MTTNCDCNKDNSDGVSSFGLLPRMPEPMPKPDNEEPCCGRQVEAPSGALEKPGYILWHFVKDFLKTTVGQIPIVTTKLTRKDYIGTAETLSGINRYNYKITPGLYCTGNPDRKSPVLVSANYKYSFDILRSNLDGISVWILVLDTRGINVWCAAGKETFATDEVVRLVNSTGIENVVDKNELILPQLSATGVSARDVKKACGFKIIWGPVRAQDIKNFLNAKNTATPEMRQVTFTIKERVLLIPIEISLVLKPLMWIFVASFVLSGIGPEIFSLVPAWNRAIMIISACIAGIITGAIAVPALLPWIPGIAFALKGAVTGILAGSGVVLYFQHQASWLELIALFICAAVVSSYLAMNFTGTTPFTSPSGVEKEMRKAIPIQSAALIIATIAWIWAPFAG